MKPLVYVAGPYTTPDPVTNTRTAIDVATKLLDEGIVTPCVPHLSLFWDLIAPHPYHVWLQLDLEIVARCDAVLRIAGHSPGADGEVEYAEARGIPVFRSIDDLHAWALAQ